jgi:phytoene synthase
LDSTLTPLATNLEISYRDCEDLARASNFYSGFRLLPKRKRQALSAVYAFLRQCDDISDEEGSAAEKKQLFTHWRACFDQAMQGDAAYHTTLPALCDAVQAFRIPVDYFYKLIDGTEMDLTRTSYPTFDDLYQYCYHVASIVGLICLHIFGFRETQAKDLAEACGVAFQLTNILRDIKEDLQRDRVYLPLEDLQRFNYSQDDLRREVMDERFRALMAFEVERARSFYVKAHPLVGMLERDSRPAFWAMFESYQSILHNIEQQGYNVLGHRIGLRPQDRLRVVLKALMKW